jgi:hypothetical protein
MTPAGRQSHRSGGHRGDPVAELGRYGEGAGQELPLTRAGVAC